jgi:tripartite-type tricarboxylate transporter receptor subunit TctC
MFPSLFTGAPFVKSGRLQALAIAGNKRSAILPDVPTLKEQGIDGVEVDQWYAIFAPAKTPKDVITKLNQALNKVLNDKEIIQRIEGHGADVDTSTPEQLGEMVRKDLVKWRQVVQRAKLQAD